MPIKTAKSKDSVQQKLRDAKKNWNLASREFIARVIAFKKGINGRGDAKKNLPVSDIKQPIPQEVSSFGNELESNFAQLMGAAEAIEAEQAAYSASKQKQMQEREQRRAKPKAEPKVEAPRLEKPASFRNLIKQASKTNKTGKIMIGKHELPTLLAITSEEQERGLMMVPSPVPVMTFVYSSRYPSINKFWMKSTPSPLDIVFSLRGKITGIFKGEPYSTASIGNDVPSDLIVEMQHGTCKQLGISVGDPVFLIQ